MIKRDLLLKLSGFDSSIIYAGEDKELGSRSCKTRAEKNV